MSALNRLQAWPIDSAQSFHRLSNRTLFDQYFGKRENRVCLRSPSSRVGRAGNLPKPITVHLPIVDSPKKHSRASLTARTLALLSVCSLTNRCSVWLTGTSLALSITDEGRAALLCFTGIHLAVRVSTVQVGESKVFDAGKLFEFCTIGAGACIRGKGAVGVERGMLGSMTGDGNSGGGSGGGEGQWSSEKVDVGCCVVWSVLNVSK